MSDFPPVLVNSARHLTFHSSIICSAHIRNYGQWLLRSRRKAVSGRHLVYRSGSTKDLLLLDDGGPHLSNQRLRWIYDERSSNIASMARVFQLPKTHYSWYPKRYHACRLNLCYSVRPLHSRHSGAQNGYTHRMRHHGFRSHLTEHCSQPGHVHRRKVLHRVRCGHRAWRLATAYHRARASSASCNLYDDLQHDVVCRFNRRR